MENQLSIKYLKSLSRVETKHTWFLIPDTTVFLNHLDFLKKFVAQDTTCKIKLTDIVLMDLVRTRHHKQFRTAALNMDGNEWMAPISHMNFNTSEIDALYNQDIYREKLIKACLGIKYHIHIVLITTDQQFLIAANSRGILTFNINELRLPEDPKNYAQAQQCFVQNKLTTFCATHQGLYYRINYKLEEITCIYTQVMEEFLDEFFQIEDVKAFKPPGHAGFDPPYWFIPGVQNLGIFFCYNKDICFLVEEITKACGCVIKNFIVRPHIKAEKFVYILGAGILLIEEVLKEAVCETHFAYYHKQLVHLLSDIKASEDDFFSDDC